MTAPRWLDDDEMRFWRAFVTVNNQVAHDVESALKADAGIGFDDYEVLVHLSEDPDGRMRMTDLSARLMHSPSRLTQRIDRLESRGLVERAKCPSDRRVTHAAITDAGFAFIERASIDHVRAVRAALIDRLSADDVRVGAELLSQVLDADVTG